MEKRKRLEREEEEQCCHSFMHTSRRTKRYRASNDYILDYCWGALCSSQACCCLEHPSISLETKQGDIKSATNKFIGVLDAIVTLNE